MFSLLPWLQNPRQHTSSLTKSSPHAYFKIKGDKSLRESRKSHFDQQLKLTVEFQNESYWGFIFQVTLRIKTLQLQQVK